MIWQVEGLIETVRQVLEISKLVYARYPAGIATLHEC